MRFDSPSSKHSWCWLIASALIPLSLHAQLAITEVMSSASTNLGPTRVPPRSDFWELTNFGTNTIDLSDCRFSDSAGIGGADASIFNGLSIAPNESIIFAQETAGVCTNAEQFRAWWGDGNLTASLQIYFYTGHGFSSLSDAVQLWHVTAASTALVDRVELYEALRGFTFTYDPVTGVLDSFSVTNEGGAFKAVETDDVGSPGFTTGAAPLAIVEQPHDLTVDAGAPAMFIVWATGLPKPRFQWRTNGVPIPGANSNTFQISAAHPGDAGQYTVELENGVDHFPSAPAVLVVNTNPSPPTIVVPPSDLSVTPGQTAIFFVNVRGYPLPTFQWQFNGTNMTGETNSRLYVANANFSSSGTYSVRIQNPLNSTNASALLAVRPKPNLVITEMMGSHSTNTAVPGHADWWELTNFDTDAVNLRGYRFDDYPGVLEGAVVITNDVTIQPGESVLFIQDMTPDAFVRWWGEENLPETVQFVHYSGNGFQAQFDAIYLWNATALDSADQIARAEYVNLDQNFNPVRGISLTFWCDGFVEFGQPSVSNQCGAVRAVEADDIGSPGYVTNHPPRTLAPRFVEIFRDALGTRLTWRTQNGRRYELQRKNDLAETNWTALLQQTASGTLLTNIDTTATGEPQRFYRLQIVPDAP